MTTILNQLKQAARARQQYRRTAWELRSLPLDVALDLDLHRPDASRVAREAVYGQ